MSVKSGLEPQVSSGAGLSRFDRAGRAKAPRSSGRRPGAGVLARMRPAALKPLTYSLMHLVVAVLVAYALTRDWRIALGIGFIEPAVQTFAYIVHEKAWSFGLRRNP